MNVEALSSQLRSSSYTVMPRLYGEGQVRRLRDVMSRLYHDLGSPPPFASGVKWLAENLEVSSTGFVIHKLLGFTRELHRELIAPEAIAVLRAVLGDDMHVEMVAGVVSDHTRPFFEWHMHLGGIDDESFRRKGLRPTFTRPERIAMLVYLDDIGPETGQLLIYPRAIDDPIDPPFPVSQQHWDGEVALTAPAGTAVLMEQSLWHAVLPRRVEEPLRMFVGFWFAAATASTAERVDDSLLTLRTDDPLLASILPPRDGRPRHG